MFENELKDQMEKSLNSFKERMSKIRAGRASLDMLNSISVDYYGTSSPLSQVASLSVVDAKTITIDPWEKTMLPVIEREIQKSDLGINPNNDGKLIRLILPPLTEERRKDFVKKAKKELEEGKISFRNIRHKFNNQLKSDKQNSLITEDEQKSKEKIVQKYMDEYTKKIEGIFAEKEKDILKI